MTGCWGLHLDGQQRVDMVAAYALRDGDRELLRKMDPHERLEDMGTPLKSSVTRRWMRPSFALYQGEHYVLVVRYYSTARIDGVALYPSMQAYEAVADMDWQVREVPTSPGRP